ncbi:hypothetical protein ACI2L4_03260 [Streptomyces sparsogenes]|uniref:DUF7224 domain-containing protein n=1 Tax=Streptomyces sparsogenes TaxID=67365 RepID=UPI0033FAF8EA
MLILPVAMALLQTRVTPTVGSLLPLFSGLILCLMHLVIGFGVGYWVPQFIAAPVLAAAVFYAVAFSVTTTSYWMRHVSGQFIEPVMFGEFIPLPSLLPPLVLAAGLALGIAILWLPFKLSVFRAGLAFIIATAAIVGARSLVDGWGASPPVTAGKAPMECVGEAPRVCMPRATAGDIEVVRREAVSVLRDLRSAGVSASPELITDRLADGRYYRRSNRITWRVQLTYGDRDRDVRYRVLKAAVGFSCARPDPAISREVRLWAVKVTGEEKEYRRELKERQESFESSAARVAAVRERVNKVLALPKDEQRDWYRKSTADACEEP